MVNDRAGICCCKVVVNRVCVCVNTVVDRV